jgi:hypothetical protein
MGSGDYAGVIDDLVVIGIANAINMFARRRPVSTIIEDGWNPASGIGYCMICAAMGVVACVRSSQIFKRGRERWLEAVKSL